MMTTTPARFKMIGLSLLLLIFAVAGARPETSHAPFATASETRCGWFNNPTPANASIYDREAEWIIGVQGGHQADGDWPDFKPAQWVKTNRDYGYGCACMRVQTNSRTHEVSTIESAEARALSACRKDAALKRWGFK
jgi:uncharacterized protein DUF4087